MTVGRGTAVAGALFLAALATAGCGLGPGKRLGDVELTVTRDYGSTPLLSRHVGDVTESDTVMRVLERNAQISTRYGGGFVQSIDGLEAEERFDRTLDWFFYVDGVEAMVGAADYPLRGGESVWWDYRDWGAAMRVPAVVGAWPQPFLGGYDGKRHPVAVECLGGGGACTTAEAKLRKAGVAPARGSGADAIRVLVGPWAKVRSDPAAAQIERGPQTSGVFADFKRKGHGYALQELGEDGAPRTLLGDEAGLIAATRRYEAPPVWVVTGATVTGAEAAARLLETAHLHDHYAVAVEGDEGIPLPVR